MPGPLSNAHTVTKLPAQDLERAQAFYARHGFREAFRTVERVFMEAKPNPSIERTAKITLRVLSSAAHVER